MSVVSNSVRPHSQQPTRLIHPWESPGKNIGVGCHFLPQGMKVKSASEATQSCPTLLDHMDCSLPGSSDHGMLRARGLEWVVISFSLSLSLSPHIHTHTHTHTHTHISELLCCTAVINTIL